MSKTKNACYFDNNRACPVRTEYGMSVSLFPFLEKACAICPIREHMMRTKPS